MPKNGFFYLFFSENQFGRPKKKVVKIFESFFENPPQPLEKFLDPPLALLQLKILLLMSSICKIAGILRKISPKLLAIE